MTEDPPNHLALLPAGLRDLLPPEAEQEAAMVASLMAVFASHGYERVQPPLVEFEDSLLAGSGAAVAEQTFRLMDPDSQRMIGVRADTTPQVARIAQTRLLAAPRPVRLSYAGPCLRVRGTQIAPDRQIEQAGMELIGCDSPEADAEIILVGVEALTGVGVDRLSIDLTLPTLAPTVMDAACLPAGQRAQLARALDRKDAAAVKRHGGPLAATFGEFLRAAGPSDRALAALDGSALPEAARPLAARLAETVRALRARAPHLRLTVDPVEFRGFRYETGVSVTIYAPNRQEELGRGGRYISGEAEPAFGLTLFPDAIGRAVPGPAPRPRVFIPVEAPGDDAAIRLRRDGFATIAALTPYGDAAAEAKRLLCSHMLLDGVAVPIAKEG
ncbi:MAG: ATP phosphoribosyltransferase regulatory subunit [Acetobacteraceae bacterium]|nr:ATP phosphoribosyltransferase regulatory subunit [Acetobacteraceae bacterium]